MRLIFIAFAYHKENVYRTVSRSVRTPESLLFVFQVKVTAQRILFLVQSSSFSWTQFYFCCNQFKSCLSLPPTLPHFLSLNFFPQQMHSIHFFTAVILIGKVIFHLQSRRFFPPFLLIWTLLCVIRKLLCAA